MTKAEFEELSSKYYEEDQWWRNLRPGQVVYTTGCFGAMDIDYYKHVIVSVDVDKRIIVAEDHTTKGHPIVELGGCVTEEERTRL